MLGEKGGGEGVGERGVGEVMVSRAEMVWTWREVVRWRVKVDVGCDLWGLEDRV